MKKRTIKKYGNTFAIKLEVADVKDYNIHEEGEVDLESVLERGCI